MANNEAHTAQQPVGNRCGCNHWMKPKCPARNCPWQGKRPVDAGAKGCDYCRNPLFASLKCPGCGRTATNGGA